MQLCHINYSNIYTTVYNLNSLNSNSTSRHRDQYRRNSRLLQVKWMVCVMQSLTPRCFSVSFFPSEAETYSGRHSSYIGEHFDSPCSFSSRYERCWSHPWGLFISFTMQECIFFCDVLGICGKATRSCKRVCQCAKATRQPAGIFKTNYCNWRFKGKWWLAVLRFVYQGLLSFSKSSVPQVPALRTN